MRKNVRERAAARPRGLRNGALPRRGEWLRNSKNVREWRIGLWALGTHLLMHAATMTVCM